jgi:spore germination protein
MGYDFSTPNSSQAGPVAPMKGAYSIFNFVSAYLERAPAEKLILAVPYYGYDWPVSSASQNGKVLGTPADVRIRTYAEILDNTVNTQINWDEVSETPWFSYLDATTGQTRVAHFENTRSLGIKYDFVNDKALGGVAIWALGFDGLKHDLAQLLSDKFSLNLVPPVAVKQ